MSTTTTDVVTAIFTGTLDADLDTLIDAVKNRREALSRQKFLTIPIGARGRLINLRPQYLIGAPVTVTGRKKSRLMVEIDADFPTGRYGKQVTVSPDMIEVV